MTDASGALAALLADARDADPTHRIDLRDPIAAHGAAAIEAVGPWLKEPALAAFAIRVIARAGQDGQGVQLRGTRPFHFKTVFGTVAVDRLRVTHRGGAIEVTAGQAVVARKAHDRVMRSMTAVLVTLATWVILAGVAVFLMVAMLVMQPPDEVTVLWQRPRHGAKEAALLACAPLLGLLVFIGLADIPWTWLVSRPTLKAGLLVPGLLLISIGMATWVCVRLSEPFKPCPLPRKAAWARSTCRPPCLACWKPAWIPCFTRRS